MHHRAAELVEPAEKPGRGGHVTAMHERADAGGRDGGAIGARELVAEHLDARRASAGGKGLDRAKAPGAHAEVSPHVYFARVNGGQQHVREEAFVRRGGKLVREGHDEQGIEPERGQHAQALVNGKQLGIRARTPQHAGRVGIERHRDGGHATTPRSFGRGPHEPAVPHVHAIEGPQHARRRRERRRVSIRNGKGMSHVAHGVEAGTRHRSEGPGQRREQRGLLAQALV